MPKWLNYVSPLLITGECVEQNEGRLYLTSPEANRFRVSPHGMGGTQGLGQGWCSPIGRHNQEGKKKTMDGKVQRLTWGRSALGTLAQVIIFIKKIDFSHHLKLRSLMKPTTNLCSSNSKIGFKVSWILTLESWKRPHGIVEGAWARGLRPKSQSQHYAYLVLQAYACYCTFVPVVDWFAKVSINTLNAHALGRCFPHCLSAWPYD